MKKLLPLLLLLPLLVGCSTARYRVVPLGNAGAGVSMSFGQQAANYAANNWGKTLSALALVGSLIKIGDNNDWWQGGSSAPDKPLSFSGNGGPLLVVTDNAGPVTINYSSNDKEEETE